MITTKVVICDMAIDGQKVRALREARGWSQDRLAAEAGATQTTIDKIERGETRRSRFLPDIARALEIGIEEIDPGFAAVRKAGDFRPPPDLVSDDQPLPVYAAAEGGDGTMILSSEAIDQSPRPYMLRGVREAYGILVTGESMVPAFRPGDVAWVDPRLPPMRGAEAIIYRIDEDGGEARASIKEMVRWTDGEWVVQQWNPAKEFKLPRAQWPKCHRVVGRLLRR